MKITENDVEMIQELSKNPDILEVIVDSIMPLIHGQEDIKKAIALQLFGGVSKDYDSFTISGELNILIVGDPAIGKTKLLKKASELAVNGIYVDNIKDQDSANLSQTHMLQNLCKSTLHQSQMICIDGFGVKADDIVLLKEALGKKSNFNTEEELLQVLKSDSSILAASNPLHGRFDRFIGILEQLALPITILSWFDLIFVVEDRYDEFENLKIAQKVLNFHQNPHVDYEINPVLLKKYVAYARDIIEPKLSHDAHQILEEFYIEIRKGWDEEVPIPITIRQLESLIKLSEANARIRLSKQITAADAIKAINIYQECLKKLGYDIEQPQEADQNLISDLEVIKVLMENLKTLQNNYGGLVPTNVLFEEISSKYGFDKPMIEHFIKKIKEQGLIFEPLQGFLKLSNPP